MEPIINSQLVLPVSPPESYRFDDFVAGENQQVVDYLRELVLAKDVSTHLCYLAGASGVGKTHLLYAVSELANEQAGEHGVSAIYLDLNELIAYSEESLLGLEQYQVVCIDNVHAVETHKHWQQGIFDLINRVLEVGHYLVFSASSMPKSLNIELRDLVSRLDWGVCFKLQPLSDEHLVDALVSKALAKGLKLPSEVASFLIKHYRRDMKSLVSVLELLDKRSLQTQRKLTIPFVKQALEL